MPKSAGTFDTHTLRDRRDRHESGLRRNTKTYDNMPLKKDLTKPEFTRSPKLAKDAYRNATTHDNCTVERVLVLPVDMVKVCQPPPNQCVPPTPSYNPMWLDHLVDMVFPNSCDGRQVSRVTNTSIVASDRSTGHVHTTAPKAGDDGKMMHT